MKKRIISVVALVLVVAMLSVVLVACAPKTFAEGKEKVNTEKFDVIPVPVVLGVGTMTIISKEDASISCIAVYVDDKDKLDETVAKYEEQYKADKKASEEKLAELKKSIKEDQNLTDEEKAEINEDIKSTEDLIKNYKFKKSGNWIAFGHKKAINELLGL